MHQLSRDVCFPVIPALQPVVHDLFVVKSASKQDVSQMTTQREVVQFMLLKLLHLPQVGCFVFMSVFCKFSSSRRIITTFTEARTIFDVAHSLRKFVDTCVMRFYFCFPSLKKEMFFSFSEETSIKVCFCVLQIVVSFGKRRLFLWNKIIFVFQNKVSFFFIETGDVFFISVNKITFSFCKCFFSLKKGMLFLEKRNVLLFLK